MLTEKTQINASGYRRAAGPLTRANRSNDRPWRKHSGWAQEGCGERAMLDAIAARAQERAATRTVIIRRKAR